MAFFTVKGVLCMHNNDCYDKKTCKFIHPKRNDLTPKKALCPFHMFSDGCNKGQSCPFAHHDMDEFMENEGFEIWESKVFGRVPVVESAAPSSASAAPSSASAAPSGASVVRKGISSLPQAKKEEKKPIALPPPTEKEQKTAAALLAAKQKLEALMFPIKKESAMSFIHENMDETTTTEQFIRLLDNAKMMLE